ncbi:MAG: penicillin acylase family protein [bacterium]
MQRFLITAMFVAGLAAGCGDDDGGALDAGTADASGLDAGDTGPRIEDLPIDEELTMSILESPVDVVVDNRGIPHIYAANIADAVRVQGYLMARDRMAQLEFLRRSIEGRMAAAVGHLMPSLVSSDMAVRRLGLHRQAQAMYDSRAADDPVKLALDAFSEGVTVYIDELRSGESELPGILSAILPASILTDWNGADTEALGRYETYLLSFTGWDDVAWTDAFVSTASAFPSGDASPAIAARAGMFHDLWHFAPATDAFTQEGLFGLGVLPWPGFGATPRAPLPGARSRLPSRQMLARARPLLDTLKGLRNLVAKEDRGSNNWIVSGAHTASGYPIMSNDPHLSLSSPPVWWMNHINTARAGGDWDTMGVSFAGTPGITLGFNRHVSWGATVTNYDVTDVYLETITPGVGGNPDTVLFNGLQVPIETITETVEVMEGNPVELQIEWIPHHGFIIPDTRQPTEAISVRWTGFTPSNEVGTFFALGTAGTVADVADAMSHLEVGSQNIVAADSAGDIFWATRSHVPVRDPRALTYDPETLTGYHPGMVLPGTGEYEWTGRLADADLPHVTNPSEGWLSTANQDPVGTTQDGNPFNDEFYLSTTFDLGHREARIQERMGSLVTRGAITPEEMSELQGDARSALGALLAAELVATLDNAAEEELSPGLHPDLTAVVTEAGATGMARLADVRDRLAGWTSFETPAAVEDTPAADEIADSVATTIFNTTLTRLTTLAFGDETDRIGVTPGSSHIARTLQWALLEPTRLVTYDAGLGDTLLWDDITTPGVEESRGDRIVRAVLQAVAWLEANVGASMDDWRWGKLHTVRFNDMMGLAAFGMDIFSIPPLDDPTFPDGFPRHGDAYAVDACNFSLWTQNNYAYSGGPSQRLVAEMTPHGPRAWNALPGGNQHDPALPHHADEAELWRRNEAPQLAYEEADVVLAAERRLRFAP